MAARMTCPRRQRRLIVAQVRIVAILLFALSLQGQTHSKGNVRIHNLMPDFWRFWNAAQDQNPPRQLELWRSSYIQPNSALFADLAAPCAKHFSDGALETDYFPTLPTLVPEIGSLQQTMPGIIADARQRFQKAFPDMAWSGDIYIMASAECFNGRSQQIQGSNALLLGLDDIVEEHETNLPPLLDHELFHRYQHVFFPFEPERDEPLWVRLWAEGMATFVAQRLNPSATDQDTLWITEPVMEDLNQRRSTLAADFLSRFSSESQHDAAVYFLDDHSQDPNIPPRTGYFLGLEVAEQLAGQYPLKQMAHWNRAQAEPHIREALERTKIDNKDGKK
jgi:hypothetical protein